MVTRGVRTDDKPDGEGAVRLYLMYLQDPSSLVDKARVSKLEADIEKAKDPVDKLKLMAELRQAQATDDSAFRQGFVQHASDWAREHGVLASDFQQLGVPDDVLAEAGLVQAPARRRRASGGRSDGSQRRTRGKNVNREDIRSFVTSRSEPFTINDVLDNVGGSQITIRKVLDELIGDQQVQRLGPKQDYQGRGRAPVEYTKA